MELLQSGKLTIPLVRRATRPFSHRGLQRTLTLLGKKRVTHVTKADVTVMMKDIMAGKTRVSEKTKKLRGKSIVRGGIGTASRAVGLLGGIFS